MSVTESDETVFKHLAYPDITDINIIYEDDTNSLEETAEDVPGSLWYAIKEADFAQTVEKYS